MFLAGAGVSSGATPSLAEWWKVYAPKDFEDCASGAEQPRLTKDDKANIISECDSKFSGRRKAGGGYTYFDFMQNRHFDIAGPNPTPEELKRIDLEYLSYLEEQRQTAVVAALVQKKQERSQQAKLTPPPQRISLRQPARQTNLQKPAGQKTTAANPRPPADLVRGRKEKACNGDALSCGWAKLATTAQNLRQALLSPNSKQDVHAQR
jgi:hypothetical protein